MAWPFNPPLARPISVGWPRPITTAKGRRAFCMERFNWFDKEYDNNSFLSDHRLPAALVGFGAPAMGINVPMNQLVGAWSSPSYAVIGMGTATMSSYAHPYQICHFFEIDEQIRLMSLPEEKGVSPWFGYVKAGRQRGADIKILMGDARLRMAMPWVPEKDVPDGPNDDPIKAEAERFKKRGGAEYFYHLMVVDAFSSDAIPRTSSIKNRFPCTSGTWWSGTGASGSRWTKTTREET